MADSVPFVVVIFDARGWSCSVVVEAVVDCGWSEKVSNMIEIGTVVSVIDPPPEKYAIEKLVFLT